MHIYKFTKVILNENRWSTALTPDNVGTRLMEIFMHPESNRVHGLILGLVFQVGGLGLTGTRVKSPWLDTCPFQFLAPYLMMPYYCMALPMILFFVGRVGGKFKDSGCALASTPSLILLSDLSHEQIRNPCKALLVFLLNPVPGCSTPLFDTCQIPGY